MMKRPIWLMGIPVVLSVGSCIGQPPQQAMDRTKEVQIEGLVGVGCGRLFYKEVAYEGKDTAAFLVIVLDKSILSPSMSQTVLVLDTSQYDCFIELFDNKRLYGIEYCSDIRTYNAQVPVHYDAINGSVSLIVSEDRTLVTLQFVDVGFRSDTDLKEFELSTERIVALIGKKGG